MKQKKGIPMRELEQQHFKNNALRNQTPPRVGARMQPAVRKASQRRRAK